MAGTYLDAGPHGRIGSSFAVVIGNIDEQPPNNDVPTIYPADLRRKLLRSDR
jgi:hypothetical protein